MILITCLILIFDLDHFLSDLPELCSNDSIQIWFWSVLDKLCSANVPWEGEAGEEHGSVTDCARGPRRDGSDVI